MNNAGENSGEAYKLSSNVGAYIFMLLQSPRAGFHFPESSNVVKPTFCRFHSIPRCFLVRESAKWWVYGLSRPYTWIRCHVSLSENMALTAHTPTTLHFCTRKHHGIEWK